METEKTSETRPVAVKSLVLDILLLVVAAGTVASVYVWQHQKVNNLNGQVISLQDEVRAIRHTATTQSQVKFVRTVGFPYDLKTTTITTNLAVPTDIDAV